MSDIVVEGNERDGFVRRMTEEETIVMWRTRAEKAEAALSELNKDYCCAMVAFKTTKDELEKAEAKLARYEKALRSIIYENENITCALIAKRALEAEEGKA